MGDQAQNCSSEYNIINCAVPSEKRFNRRLALKNPADYEARVKRRFWEKVKTGGTNECWIWQGSLMNYGIKGQDYGMTAYYGKRAFCHRLSWSFKFGPIPEGMCVMHICDNPRCVNPDHLRIGTQGENMKDRNLKGRTWSKLTEEQVMEARSRYKRCSKTDGVKALAREFGVGVTTMHQAIQGKVRWKNVDPPSVVPKEIP